MGESDRLLTILTREYGLIQVLAMGSRKHNSSLSGRSGLFVVNHLLIAKGKTLDKLTQAETLESYPKLGQDLKKLTASQYLAELCLCQALSDQPQAELFDGLNQHLQYLERSPDHLVLPYLTYAILQLLTLEGVAPQLQRCCVTQTPLAPDWQTPAWRVGFSAPAGGVITLEALHQLQHRQSTPTRSAPPSAVAREQSVPYQPGSRSRGRVLHQPISAMDLALLQAIAQLNLADQPLIDAFAPVDFLHPTLVDWLAVERLLRQYAQYHFDRPIRSATLMDACFPQLPTPSIALPPEMRES
jgi:DNA repair protein RecO (recombination protein O)